MTAHKQFFMRLTRVFQVSFVVVLFLTLLTGILPAQAQAQTSVWGGVCVGGADSDVATIQGAQCLIANVFMVIITLIGLVGFVMFLVGAIQWMVSGTNAQGVQKARSTMLYSVVGLVVALSAFIIINLIADFTGVNVIRNFQIPTSSRGVGPGSCSVAHPGASCILSGHCAQTDYGSGGCGSPNLVCCGP